MRKYVILSIIAASDRISSHCAMRGTDALHTCAILIKNADPKIKIFLKNTSVNTSSSTLRQYIYRLF